VALVPLTGEWSEMGPNRSWAARSNHHRVVSAFGRSLEPMPADPPDHSHVTAVEQLTALGLSTYAARTFVALVRLGDGTAEDVSNVAEVPRTRVYDAVEELRSQGLVDVQESSPKRFWAVSTETASRHFQREYTYRVRSMTDALEGIAPSERSTEQRGVWTVTGRDAVAERVLELLASAEEEIAYMTVEELLDERVVEELRAAGERGVTIHLAETSGPTHARLADEVPDGRLFESVWERVDTPAGRLLMVDEERTLASVLVPGDGDHPPEPRDETAIWGGGAANSLVVVLKAMFTWQLDGSRE